MAALRAPVTARAPWLTAVLNAGAAARSRGPPGGGRGRGPAGPAGGGGLPLPAAPGPDDGRLDARRRDRSRCRAGARPRGCWPGTRTPRTAWPTACCDLLGTLRGPWSAASWPACRSVTRRRAPWPPGCPPPSWPTSAAPASSTSSTTRRPGGRRWSAAAIPASSSGGCPRSWPARPIPAPAPSCGPPRGCTPPSARWSWRWWPSGGVLRAGLLTLVDGDDRWPWWGTGDVGGLRTEMGAPLVGLTAPGARMAGAERAQSRRSTVTSGASSVGARPDAQPDLALGAHPALGRLAVHRSGAAPGARRPGRSSTGGEPFGRTYVGNRPESRTVPSSPVTREGGGGEVGVLGDRRHAAGRDRVLRGRGRTGS